MNKSGQLLAHLLTAFVSLIGSWLIYSATADKTTVSFVERLQERIVHLEEGLQQRQDDNLRLTIQLAKMESELAKKFDQAKEVATLLGGMPTPAWIKVVIATDNPARPRLENWYVNRAYTEFTGITASRYKGKTDFEVGWPQEVAETFYQNDLESLRIMDSTCRIESFPDDLDSPQQTLTGQICKWPTRIENRLAIAGVLFDPRLIETITLLQAGEPNRLRVAQTIHDVLRVR